MKQLSRLAVKHHGAGGGREDESDIGGAEGVRRCGEVWLVGRLERHHVEPEKEDACEHEGNALDREQRPDGGVRARRRRCGGVGGGADAHRENAEHEEEDAAHLGRYVGDT